MLGIQAERREEAIFRVAFQQAMLQSALDRAAGMHSADETDALRADIDSLVARLGADQAALAEAQALSKRVQAHLGKLRPADIVSYCLLHNCCMRQHVCGALVKVSPAEVYAMAAKCVEEGERHQADSLREERTRAQLGGNADARLLSDLQQAPALSRLWV